MLDESIRQATSEVNPPWVMIALRLKSIAGDDVERRASMCCGAVHIAMAIFSIALG